MSETLNNVPGIYVQQETMANMDVERIVVSNPAIVEILKIVKLPAEDQKDAVNQLVDRTLDWEDLEYEDQINRIKSVLTMETVLYYLEAVETVRPQVDIIEMGVDQEGSVVIYAYYTNLNREQRRMVEQAMDEADKQKMVEAVNILGGNDNLLDLARERMKKLAEQAQEGQLTQKKMREKRGELKQFVRDKRK